MPDTDKILEAEKNIRQISEELARMKDAADLLNSSQKTVDATLTASENIVKASEDFIKDCGVIIKKLSDTDLTEKFDDLQKLHVELKSESQHISSHIVQEIDKINVNLESQVSAMVKSISEINKKLETTSDKMDLIDSKNRKMLSIITTILILTFLSSVAVLVLGIIK